MVMFPQLYTKVHNYSVMASKFFKVGKGGGVINEIKIILEREKLWMVEIYHIIKHKKIGVFIPKRQY